MGGDHYSKSFRQSFRLKKVNFFQTQQSLCDEAKEAMEVPVFLVMQPE
jgi:hypothetical protein